MKQSTKHFFVVMEESIKENFFVRLILLPFVYAVRFIKKLLYSNGKDSLAIKSLKDIHKGERCILVGNGPSLSPADLDMIKGEIAFASNRIYKIYKNTEWRPTYYMVTDPTIAKDMLNDEEIAIGATDLFFRNTKLVNKYRAQNSHSIFCQGKIALMRATQAPRRISNDVSSYFSLAPTVMFSSFELAMYMGFSEVIFIGVDHTYPKEINRKGEKVSHNVRSHFVGDDYINKNNVYIDSMEECFKLISNYAKSHDVTVYNCTRGGKLEIFERRNLEDII